MSRIDDYIIDSIKEASSLEELISDFVDLKKSGVQFIGLSPFNDEKTPSLTINVKKNIWKCFSSGKGGKGCISFLMALEYSFIDAVQYLAKKYNVSLGDMKTSSTASPVIKKKPFKKPNSIPYTFTIDEVKETMCNYEDNYFVQFLLKTFGKEKTIKAIELYNIGTKNNSVVYWQVSIKGVVRAAKVMSYNIDNGSSKGQRKPYFIKPRNVKQDQVLKQCFYGEHIAVLDKEKEIAIVESEKTAIICSLFFDRYLWVACGGLQNISSEKLEIFKDRNIVLFPDLQAFKEWENKSFEYSYKYSITTSKILEENATDELIEKKADLADLVLLIVNQQQQEEEEEKMSAEIKPSEIVKPKPDTKKLLLSNPKITQRESLENEKGCALDLAYYYADNPFEVTPKNHNLNGKLFINDLANIDKCETFYLAVNRKKEALIDKNPSLKKDIDNILFYFLIIEKCKTRIATFYINKFNEAKENIKQKLNN